MYFTVGTQMAADFLFLPDLEQVIEYHGKYAF